MENSKTRAIEAIRENTVEGPVRARSISAIAQVDTTGKTFKLFLEGSRRQGDAVLKTLKTAGIIETVRIAKPGQKALYTIAEEYREDPIVTEIVEEEEEFDSGHLTHMWIVEQVYDQLDEIEAGWELPTRMKVAQLKARSILHNGEIEGKLGEAIDSILWTIALYPEGVTVEDFPMEGPTGVSYSDRTLKTALGLLKSAGVVEVVGGGRSLRRYRAA